MGMQYENRIVGHGSRDPRDLLENPENWRTHSAAQLAALAGVLENVGFVQSVIVNQRTGLLVDGHARVALAVKTGQPAVPVVFVDLSKKEERLILATLDPLGALANSDADKLESLMGTLDIRDPAFAGLLESLEAKANQETSNDKGQRLLPADPQITKGPILDGLVYRPRTAKTRSIEFLTFRKWRESIKKQTVADFREAKYRADPDLLAAAVADICDNLALLFGDIAGAIFTAPPAGASAVAGKAHFATELAKAVADKVGGEYLALFKPPAVAIASRRCNVKDRTSRELCDDVEALVSGRLVFVVDDVATTGTTLEGCLQSIRTTGPAVGLVWVYENEQ